jgi:purine catabolism regulator
MGLPTVREVWRLALPTETQLLGGEDGLIKPVQWARRMAVHPPAFAALEEGEIALLSVEALSLLDERLTLARVVESLAEREATALAVVGEVSGETRAMAETCWLPLFLLPADADLRDIERDIIRLIVEREAQLDRRGRQIYRQLAQHSIEGLGLPAIAQAMLGITGKPVVIQDERLSIHTLAWPEGCTLSPEELAPPLGDASPLRQWLWGRPLDGKAPPCTELILDPFGWTRCVAAFVIEGELGGYLSLLGPAGSLDDLDRLAVERGALVCAVELAKQRAVEAAEDRLRGDFLDLLLTAGPAEERALARRAAEMGCELELHHAVVIFGLDEDSPQTLPLLASEFRAHILNTGSKTFLCPYEADLVVLCSAEDVSSLRHLEELTQSTRERLTQLSSQARVAAGIGRPGAGLAGLRNSFGQAREALELARRLFGGDKVLPFSDLGIYRLLYRLQDSEELVEFYEQTLASLAQYDASHNTELVPTLEAFFAHHGNVSQTAESLYLHRNSLLYRLERISEITGLDLDDADDRFSLQLALKIRPLLGRSPNDE